MTAAAVLSDAIRAAFPLIQEYLIDWSVNGLVRAADNHRVLVNIHLHDAARKYNGSLASLLNQCNYAPCNEPSDVPGFELWTIMRSRARSKQKQAN
jgi:hypothetical protein